jgi:zinc-binding oxidoreductase
MSVQAVQYDCFGPVENLKLANVPGENPEEGQVKIAVHAVGLNPVDYKIFEGSPQLRMLSRVMKIRNPRRWFESKKAQFPRGVGRDFSGTVTEVGPGVSGYFVGDEVFGTIVSAPGLGTKRGSLATEICVNTGDIALKPASIDFDHAAAMGVAALTVGGAFRHIGVGAGDTVVISAASGGIGSTAVQYAVARGARVVGIAGAANAEFVRSLGAVPVAYGEGVRERVLKAAEGRVTKFLDCYGGDYVSLAFSLGLKGKDIGTLVPSPKVIIRERSLRAPATRNTGILKP